jgi:S1-C subfamily serine protease
MMKRSVVLSLAAVFLLAACTRTVVRGDGTGTSPAVLSSQGNSSGNRIVNVVQAVRPAVVNVTTDIAASGPFGSGGRGVGTGFIVRADGIIVTNYHVVEKAQRITVITPSPDAQRYDARVIGGDATADLAVLKIDAQGLPTVPLGDSSTLQLGQPVVAIGYALALKGGPTVTTGIVSALGRSIQAGDPNCDACQNGARTYSNVIQTDAAINPGNSGGPLLNLDGQVIGINTAGNASAENIGFAIAINAALPTVSSAESDPTAPVPYLGVSTQPVGQGLALQFNLPTTTGAYVVGLSPDGPAQTAGMEVGDVIVEFDGHTVTDPDALGTLIRQHRPGDSVQVGVVNARGDHKTYDVTLGVNPLPQP